MNDGQRTVTAALLVSAVLITADGIIAEGGLPPLRSYLGLVFGGIMLGIIAEPAPAVAAGLATLMALGIALTRGPRVLSSIGGVAR